MAAVTLMITNEKGLDFFPPTVEGIQLSSSRRGSPGTLKFTVLKDEAMGEIGGFAEGFSAISLLNAGTSPGRLSVRPMTRYAI